MPPNSATHYIPTLAAILRTRYRLQVNMRLIKIFTLLFSAYCVNGQTLSLDDIFLIRTLDSLELIKFGQEKGFELKVVEMDNWRSIHKYYSTDSSTTFERNFPTGRNLFTQDTTTRDNRMVYYHFRDKETLKEFKGKMKANGFKFKRTDTKDYGGNRFTHNIYVTTENEIDLASEKIIGQKLKYTLIYYRRMN